MYAQVFSHGFTQCGQVSCFHPAARSVPDTARIFATFPGAHLSWAGGVLDQFLAAAVFLLCVCAITDRRQHIFCNVVPLKYIFGQEHACDEAVRAAVCGGGGGGAGAQPRLQHGVRHQPRPGPGAQAAHPAGGLGAGGLHRVQPLVSQHIYISTPCHLHISIISTQVAGPHTGHPCWRPGRGLALLPRGGGQLAGRGRGGRGEVRQRGGGRPRHRGVSAGGRGQTTARSIINNFAPQYAQLAQYQSSLPVSPGPNLKM